MNVKKVEAALEAARRAIAGIYGMGDEDPMVATRFALEHLIEAVEQLLPEQD